MGDSLRKAYALISAYKHGGVSPGSRISKPQQRLLGILAIDLGVSTDRLDLQSVIPLLAEADSRWNHRTMALINELYALRESGRMNEAQALRESFMSGCPSHWYRGIVGCV